MKPFKHNHRRAVIDPMAWLLGTTIVVLAVLDLLIWATLWNVPNPVSKLLATSTTVSAPSAAAPAFDGAAPPATTAPPR
jgi:hypothetical protein